MHMDVSCNSEFVTDTLQPGMVHVSVDVEKDQDVECSFENTRNAGSIKIIKTASGGESDANFGFEVIGLDGFSDILTAGGATPMDMTGPVTVRTGTYNIWETIPEGWMHMGVTCNVEFEDLSSVTMGHVQFTVDKGDEVICTFDNARNMGTLKIIKNASGGEANGEFGFEVAGPTPIDPFTLIAGDENTAMDMTGPVDVRTGIYQIWETIPDGWMHMDVSCNSEFVTDTLHKRRVWI
jgi:hypothetical protein